MPGRGALQSVSEALSDIRGTNKAEHNAGVSGSDTSAIGGAGRKGASGHGTLDEPAYTRIDAEVTGKPMNDTASGGMMGYDSGFGRTFTGAGSRRKED